MIIFYLNYKDNQVDSGKILSSRALNTLMFSDPYAKLCYTSLLVSQFDKVIYIDLDTMFSGYFMEGLVSTKNRIDIYLPAEGKISSTIKDVLASMQSLQNALVIFDSVNSFYNMFKMRQTTLGNLNHLLSVLLMLLVRRGVDTGIPVLATSMLRYRKDRGWTQSPASRRLLQNKSIVKLSVERNNKDLVVKIVEHDSMALGTELVYKNGTVIIPL